MSAVDVLTPNPATSAERAACTSALGGFVAAIGSTTADIDTAAQALIVAVEAAPAGTLRETARARVCEAAAMAHLSLALGGAMPGIPGGDLAASLASIGCALAVRALNGGTL
jgi:hypothetical protein